CTRDWDGGYFDVW
nr:immunoglobulin heavy chain junction region [Mus musculus]MBK4184850.1 immunoglobulin heavy chain junction region [Mus musculus]